MKTLFLVTLLASGIVYNAQTDRTARLVSCEVKVDPEAGAYYVGMYEDFKGRIFPIESFADFCPDEVDSTKVLSTTTLY